MEAYFDNSATTRVLDSVMDIVTRTMTVDYANPAAKHIRGMEAENYIRDARSIIAKTLKVADKEILFTSGGSESNNMALIGTAMANKRAGMHIISTNVEHASTTIPWDFCRNRALRSPICRWITTVILIWTSCGRRYARIRSWCL